MRRGALLASLLALAATGLSAGQPSIEAIRARGVIVFAALAGDDRPHLYRDGEEWRGTELAYVRKLAARLGVAWRIDIAPSYDECLDRLESGSADVLLAGAHANTEDARAFLFSKPYRELDCYLIVDRMRFARSAEPFPKKLEEELRGLEGSRIGVDRRSSARIFLRGFPDSEIIGYDSQSGAAAALFAGALEACVVDEREYAASFRDSPRRFLFYRPIKILTHHEEVSMAVHWKNEDLLRVVDLILAERAYDR